MYLIQRGRLVVFSSVLWFPPPKNWLPGYNWNILESGVKHHNPNSYPTNTVTQSWFLFYHYLFYLTLKILTYFVFIWVSDCYVKPNEQFFSHIVAGTSYILMRWWWWRLLCSSYIVLADWINSPRVDMSHHLDTL